jgi:hypothetical protein
MSPKNRLFNPDQPDDETEKSSESTAIDETATDVVNSSTDADRIDAIVNNWINTHIHGSKIARHTESWNCLQDKLPHLVKALKE